MSSMTPFLSTQFAPSRRTVAQLFWSRHWVILLLFASYALPGTQRAVLDYCISLGSRAGGLQHLSCACSLQAATRRRWASATMCSGQSPCAEAPSTHMSGTLTVSPFESSPLTLTLLLAALCRRTFYAHVRHPAAPPFQSLLLSCVAGIYSS